MAKPMLVSLSICERLNKYGFQKALRSSLQQLWFNTTDNNVMYGDFEQEATLHSKVRIYYQLPSLFTRWSKRCIQTKLTSPTGHEKCGNVNPGKPDLLAGNVLQQHYNFSLLVLCLHLTIIDCRASGLSQIQLQNSKNSTKKSLNLWWCSIKSERIDKR